MLGHAHPAVTAALSDQVAKGTAYAFSSPHEVALAERIRARTPSLERVRFTNSGLEATMLAIKTARGAMGRDRIAKFEGGYHGTHDAVQVSVRPPLQQAGPRDAPRAVADAAGVPRSAVENVVVLPFNDLAATTRLLTAHRDELATVIVEPVLGAAGIVPPVEGFLAGLRRLTSDLGLLLIFDEVISFRLAPGGAQEWYAVEADLTALGKIIGGGLPIGAFGGRADLMAQFEPRGGSDVFDPGSGGPAIYQGGTFSGNPLSMVAGIATLDALKPEVYARLNALGARLRAGLTQIFDDLAAPAQVTGVGSLFNIHFTRSSIFDARGPRDADGEAAHLFFLEMLNRGFVIAPRGMGAISTPMHESDVDLFVSQVREALFSVLQLSAPGARA